MEKLQPKTTTEEHWKQLNPSRAYAIRSGEKDFIHFRFGKGKGFYITVAPTKLGRLVKSVDYENGGESLLHNLTAGTLMILGRSQESAIKIIHAFISRQHAELLFEDDILMVRDLGSINGTYIHTESLSFDIDEYMAEHPVDQMSNFATDPTHEKFGAGLDNFLKRYLAKKDTIT